MLETSLVLIVEHEHFASPYKQNSQKDMSFISL